MKITVDQKDLAQGLRAVGRAISSRSTLPVLQQVLMRADENRLELAATDLEIGIRFRMTASYNEPGRVLAPGKLLTEYVNTFSGGEVTITTRPYNSVNVACDRSEASLATMSPDEFPPFRDDDSQILAVEPDDFKALIESVEFSAAKDEARPVLTGVLCRFHEHGLIMVCADGFRLAVNRIERETAIKEPREIILPARAMREMARAITDQKRPVEIGVSGDGAQVLMEAGYVDVISQTIAGRFPDYSQIIPERYETRVAVVRSELLNAVRTAHVFSRDAANIVKLEIVDGLNGGQVTVRGKSAEVGDTVVELDAYVEGENPVTIAFNAQYLIEALAAMTAAMVTLDVVDAQRPGVIRPVGAEYPTYVLMPMHTDPEPRRGYATVEEMDEEAEVLD